MYGVSYFGCYDQVLELIAARGPVPGSPPETSDISWYLFGSGSIELSRLRIGMRDGVLFLSASR